MYIETSFRSVIKTITWRFIATLTTVLLVYYVAKKPLLVAMEVGGLELVIKLIAYYLHERAWNRVRLGKKEIKPFVLWITGLPGAGKQSMASLIEKYLQDRGFKVQLLSEERLQTLFPGFAYDHDSRFQQVKAIAYLSAMLEKNGIMVVAPFVAPHRDGRAEARELCHNFIEVYISTPIEECQKNDARYDKAKKGEFPYFPGVNIPYEEPLKPEVEFDLSKTSRENAFQSIKDYLNKYIS